VELLAQLLRNNSIEAPLAVVDAALERLVDLRTILKRTQTGYEFAVMAFPRVLTQSPQWLGEFLH
jgi:hypothetical protein